MDMTIRREIRIEELDEDGVELDLLHPARNLHSAASPETAHQPGTGGQPPHPIIGARSFADSGVAIDPSGELNGGSDSSKTRHHVEDRCLHIGPPPPYEPSLSASSSSCPPNQIVTTDLPCLPDTGLTQERRAGLPRQNLTGSAAPITPLPPQTSRVSVRDADDDETGTVQAKFGRMASYFMLLLSYFILFLSMTAIVLALSAAAGVALPGQTQELGSPLVSSTGAVSGAGGKEISR